MSYLRIDKVTPLQKCNGNEDIYRSQKIQTSAPPPIETVPIRVPTVGSRIDSVSLRKLSIILIAAPARGAYGRGGTLSLY